MTERPGGANVAAGLIRLSDRRDDADQHGAARLEHVDHIANMRRYQVLIESSFPSEAGVMLRNLENKGNQLHPVAALVSSLPLLSHRGRRTQG